MGKPKVATVWLEGCSGCHMSFLDLDEKLLDILSKIDLTVTPITDFKDYEFPEVDVGIIEGGIGNQEALEIARHLRERSGILVAWGDCAVFGGINTLRNWIPREEVLRRAYIETESTVSGVLPVHPELPALLDKVRPVNEVVSVDVFVPGCPPSPEAIAYSLTEILQGRLPVLPTELIHFD
ncbi:MAG: NADP oxidoreductase [Deltaproteobacteria bacterium]|nr:NADP oxidoreductase [Deltaproteobacteria bacterium]MBW1960025.1 NADP oxidoreductase [Deltaproteobacteria bacterium]MBW2151217.1 NADP oxidoreductase [Deltaproteobacteria bacterium]